MDTPFAQAVALIEDKDATGLRRLLNDHPELVRATDQNGDTLLAHTLSYANDVGDCPEFWTATPCAEVLIEAGAEVDQDIYWRAVTTSDTPMVQMFHRRGVLPENLLMAAAAGAFDEVQAFFQDDGSLTPDAGPSPDLLADPQQRDHWPDPADAELILARAFCLACGHRHVDIARYLLERAMHQTPDLRRRIEAQGGAEAALELCLESANRNDLCTIWELMLCIRFNRAFDANDVAAFQELLEEAPEFLTAGHVRWQIGVLEVAAYSNRPEIARALLDAGASVQNQGRPDCDALRYAIDYGCKEMIELLTPLWQPHNDLPTMAGLGRLEQVARFFDDQGQMRRHATLVYPEGQESSEPAQVLVHALGLACMNEELEVAQFLLDHGADINSPWGLHEPATVLHEVAGHGRMKAVRFLIERGADPTIRDYRFRAMAHDWAEYCGAEEASVFLLTRAAQQNLFAAIQLGDVALVRRLLDAGHDPNQTVDFPPVHGFTPLFEAVVRDQPQMVAYLLEHGADAAACSNDGRGAVHRLKSDSRHSAPMAAALIQHGLDIYTASTDGITPLDHVRAEGLHDVVALLLQHGEGPEPD